MMLREQESDSAGDPLSIADSDGTVAMWYEASLGAGGVGVANTFIFLLDSMDKGTLEASESDGHLVDAERGVRVAGRTSRRAVFRFGEFLAAAFVVSRILGARVGLVRRCVWTSLARGLAPKGVGAL